MLSPKSDGRKVKIIFSREGVGRFGLVKAVRRAHSTARMTSWSCAGFLVLALASISISIPIDNGVEGEPEIECGASLITTNFNTKNIFEGHVFVLGRYGEPGCRSDDKGQRVAGIKLPFDKCGTLRQRSLNPKGIYVTTTVVITFHPQFLTKVDRAYRVQCFYMEADKTVSQELEVSEITTAFQTQTVPMPVCSYQVLEGGPNGQPVRYASIGQQVYHKWTCVTETTDIFCAIVHSCVVDDGAGNRVQLLDQSGCALDRYLLQNLEYTSDLMAGQEAHVFKYADKPALVFQCQISITIKEPNQQCLRPQCPAYGSVGAAAVARFSDPSPVVRALAANGTNRLLSNGLSTAGPPQSIVTVSQSVNTQQPVNVNLPTANAPSFNAPTTNSPTIREPNGNSPTIREPNARPPTAREPSINAPTVNVIRPAPAPPPQTNSSGQAFRRRNFDFPFRFRRLRRAPDAEDVQEEIGVWDVQSQPITALDVGEHTESLGSRRLAPETKTKGFCLSPVAFFTMFCFAVVSPVAVTILFSILWLRRCRKNSKK